MVQILQVEKFDCSSGRVCIETSKGIRPLKSNSGVPTFNELFHSTPGVAGSSIVIRESTFFQIGSFNTELSVSQDKALIIELLKAGISIGWSNEALVIHRIHYGDRLTSGLG